jgi:hypothetical protein
LFWRPREPVERPAAVIVLSLRQQVELVLDLVVDRQRGSAAIVSPQPVAALDRRFAVPRRVGGWYHFTNAISTSKDLSR